jgi:hypothetical protein
MEIKNCYPEYQKYHFLFIYSYLPAFSKYFCTIHYNSATVVHSFEITNAQRNQITSRKNVVHSKYVKKIKILFQLKKSYP